MTPALPFLAREDLETAVASVRRVLAARGVFAIPTETFYGLAAAPTDAVAIDRVFAVKGRPGDKALPVVAASLAQVDALVHLADPWRSRLASVWPAPLSAVLPVVRPLPFTASTLAIRVPAHPLLLELLAAVGPLTATSANLAGSPPSRTAVEVREGLSEGLSLVLDGGQTPGGRPSTLIDCSGPVAKLLRPGAFEVPGEWGVKPV